MLDPNDSDDCYAGPVKKQRYTDTIKDTTDTGRERNEGPLKRARLINTSQEQNKDLINK